MSDSSSLPGRETGEPASNLHALLIGVDHYLPGHLPGGMFYPDLEGCVRDVGLVEGFLRGVLRLPTERITRLTSTTPGQRNPSDPPEVLPSYENIVKAMLDLSSRAVRGDQVYIHYSGHGGQARTIFPTRKGADGLDEALVPFNIHDRSARYVRDLELAAILKAMTDKGLIVHLVLDCCHSGGATRGALNEVGVRGVQFVDDSERPTESLVELPDALATRGLSPGEGLLPDPKGYTFLAACSPFEKAREFAFDGKEKHGALTYWLLDALQKIGPHLTYKRLHDRVLTRIHSQFPSQTPMLQGEADRVVFGVERVPPRFSVLVTQVDLPGKRIRLGAGEAVGVRNGSQFSIYSEAPGEGGSSAGRKAVVQVEEPGAVDSWATFVGPEENSEAPIEQGDHAVLLGAGSESLVRGVRVMRPDGSPCSDNDVPLKALEPAIQSLGAGWLEISTEKPADFLVTLTPQGDAYEICDRDGVPLPNLRPAIGIGDPEAPASLVKRLVHLARYRAVRELDNLSTESSLKGKLVVELVGWQADYTKGEPIKPIPFAAGVPSLKVGQTTWLKIRNELPAVPGQPEANVLNITVLDLQPNWGITQVMPRREDLYSEPLGPGRELLAPHGFRLTANLPDTYSEGTDTLKVLATLGPSNFRVLELPALEQADTGEKAPRRRARGGMETPLTRLLEAISGEQPGTRSLTPAASASEEWTMVQIDVRIVRA